MSTSPSDQAEALDAYYTIQQLAEISQTTIRNIRAYQERGIFPPPEKRGRIGIYRESHVVRLAIINQLLSRGYSIANIGEMLHAHERGQDINQFIGLNNLITNLWSSTNPVILSIEELAARFSQPPSAEDIQYALQVGVLEIAEQHQVKISDGSLLQLAAILIDYHFSFRQLLDLVVKLRQTLNQAATSIANIGLSIILPPENPSDLTLDQPDRPTQLVQQLQPLLTTIVDIEMGNALSRSFKEQMAQRMASQVLKHASDSSQ